MFILYILIIDLKYQRIIIFLNKTKENNLNKLVTIIGKSEDDMAHYKFVYTTY